MSMSWSCSSLLIVLLLLLAKNAAAQCPAPTRVTYSVAGQGTSTVVEDCTSAVWQVPASKVTVSEFGLGYITAGTDILLDGGTLTASNVDFRVFSGNVATASNANILMDNAGGVMTIGSMTGGTLRFGSGGATMQVAQAQGVSVTITGGGNYATFATATSMYFSMDGGAQRLTGNVGQGGTIFGTGGNTIDVTATSNRITLDVGMSGTVTGDGNTVTCLTGYNTCNVVGARNVITIAPDPNLPTSPLAIITAGSSNTLSADNGGSGTVRGLANTAYIAASAQVAVGSSATAFVSQAGTATLESGARGSAGSGAVITVSPSIFSNFVAASGAVATLAPSATLNAARGVAAFNTDANFRIRTVGTTTINAVTYDQLSNAPYVSGVDPDRRRRRARAMLSPDEMGPQTTDAAAQRAFGIMPPEAGGCAQGLVSCLQLGGTRTCVDVQSDIFNCGGCAYSAAEGLGASHHTISGVDCTVFSDEEVICVQGKCQSV